MLLSILRHGKAEPQSHSGRDADRRLTPLGRAQAAYIGGLFALREAPHTSPPRIVISSDAVRARQTAELVATALARTSGSTLPSASRPTWRGTSHS
jgi:phosphohistidine phosphatase SixA